MFVVNTLPLCEHFPAHLGGNAGATNFYNLDFHAASDLLVAIGETADTGIKGTNKISGIVGMISAYEGSSGLRLWTKTLN